MNTHPRRPHWTYPALSHELTNEGLLDMLRYRRGLAMHFGRPAVAALLCRIGMPMHWAVITLCTTWEPRE